MNVMQFFQTENAERIGVPSEFRTLPMDLSPEEIASLLSRLLELNPPPTEGVQVIGALCDRQQLHWKPLDASSLTAIDAWLERVWSHDFAFVDGAATLAVSLGLPRALRCLQATANRADDDPISRLAREALDER